jgi:hypothetical protein
MEDKHVPGRPQTPAFTALLTAELLLDQSSRPRQSSLSNPVRQQLKCRLRTWPANPRPQDSDAGELGAEDWEGFLQLFAWDRFRIDAVEGIRLGGHD